MLKDGRIEFLVEVKGGIVGTSEVGRTQWNYHKELAKLGFKLNSIGEINTIRAQLEKTKPDEGIIKQAWNRLETLAKIASIASLI